jgi:hypothetical protein
MGGGVLSQSWVVRTGCMTPHEDKLPPVTADLVISMTMLELFRDSHGARWCHDDFVGPLRKKLGHPRENRKGTGTDAALADARNLLAEFCVACPHACIMKGW